MAEPRRHQWWVLAGLVAVFMGASQGLSWWAQERAGDLARQHARPGDITMYSTTNCLYCAKARRWLDEHQVPWRECNIDLSKACQQTFDAQGAPGTPLMLVKGRWHLGFDAEWLGEALQATPLNAGRPAPP
ncbi:MAG: glutaredoxin family protein [Rubrivivax sp.]|nr:MAG: glutaredoxin family protein [Rubrivivax sp.]